MTKYSVNATSIHDGEARSTLLHKAPASMPQNRYASKATLTARRTRVIVRRPQVERLACAALASGGEYLAVVCVLGDVSVERRRGPRPVMVDKATGHSTTVS